MGFEQAWRLSFTLVGTRADEPTLPVSMSTVYTYSVNGTVRLQGYIRVLEEKLSPTEDYQRYELTDRFDDIQREPFLRAHPDFPLINTMRFIFNDENSILLENNLNTAIITVAGASSIITGISWTSPPTNLIEKNISMEGRNIGEFITELLKFNPAWRWYYNSSDGKIVLKDLLAASTPKEVFLSKMYGTWSLRSPNYNDVVSVDIRVDKSDCYEKVRLEGFGIFEYKSQVMLKEAWQSNCLPNEHKGPCYRLVPPYYVGTIKPSNNAGDFITVDTCPEFACWYKMPEDFVPSPFSFSDDGKFTQSSTNEMLIEANIPSRNKGQCMTPDDFPNGEVPPNVSLEVCNKQPVNDMWAWTDFKWTEVARISPFIAKNPCGERIINLCPTKMISFLPVWSPPSPAMADGLPGDPNVIIYELRASFWATRGPFIIEATGAGCPNGRVYQRYNIDWIQIYKNSVLVRDDSVMMQAFADALIKQVGIPKVSATITIHLHPVDVLKYEYVNNLPAIDIGNGGVVIALGDTINISYETLIPGEISTGPGVLPNASQYGTDLTWANMALHVMSMTFNRLEQSLVLEIANSPYIHGDRILENLQR
jgi:hypothetical protein